MNNDKSETVINLENVSFTYKGNNEPTVKNINLEVKKGEFIGLIGPTGSGKTTLLNLIAGVLPHYIDGEVQGNIRVMGKETKDMSMAELSRLVGLVMQDPESQLFNLFVRDEVIWGLENLGIPREQIAKERDRVAKFFLIDHLIDRITYDLSGGEKQKVALASTYIMKPAIFVFDNPTSQLDPLGSAIVFEAICNLAKEEGTTVIVNEDKVEELAAFSDRLWLINNGQIMIDEKPREFFTKIDLLKEALIRMPPVTEIGYELEKLGYDMNCPFQCPEAIESFKKIIHLK